MNDQTMHTDFDPMSKLLGTSVNETLNDSPSKPHKIMETFYSEGESDSLFEAPFSSLSEE